MAGAGTALGLLLSWACAPLLPIPTGDALARVQGDRPHLTLRDLQCRLQASTRPIAPVGHRAAPALQVIDPEVQWDKADYAEDVEEKAKNLRTPAGDSILSYLKIMAMSIKVTKLLRRIFS